MNCKSCGNDHLESYCPACGEKAFKPSQLSVKHFVEETFEGIVHFDSKFFRTIKTLIAKPGQLSLDYTEGRRVMYMKPIPFFLLVNILFFLIAGGNNLYSLSLGNYINYQPFTNFNTKHIVLQKLHDTGLSMPEYERLFNEKIIAASKEFIFLFIPFYGLLFSAVLFRKKKYFVEHLVFAIHLLAFILLFIMAHHYLVIGPYYFLAKNHYSERFDFVDGWFMSLVIATYLSFAIRRFYKVNIIWSLTVSLAFGWTFLFFIQFYRMLLFFKILYL
ncbi:hypothetical protein BH09BAC6_BH09BAC6_15260 [soil metagenome]|jgi:hypothetical protein